MNHFYFILSIFTSEQTQKNIIIISIKILT